MGQIFIGLEDKLDINFNGAVGLESLIQDNGAVPVLDVGNQFVLMQQLYGGAECIVGERQVMLCEIKAIVLKELGLIEQLVTVGVLRANGSTTYQHTNHQSFNVILHLCFYSSL